MKKMIDETELEMSLGDGNKVIEKMKRISHCSTKVNELQKIYTKITRLQIHL